MVTEKVGWIGLGNIGAPMAQRLTGRDGGLVVCDTNPSTLEPFIAADVEAVADAREVTRSGATFISIVVRDDAQVRTVVNVLAQADPTPGTVVAIHSTIEPTTAQELADAVAQAGLIVVDAPVSGGFMGAATGRLAVLLGAPDEVVERCRSAFAPFADKVVVFGPVGAGTRAKIARNLITFTSFAMVGEAQRLAQAAGIDLLALGDVVRHSDAVTGGPGSIMIRDTTEPLANDDPLRSIFGHTLQLGTKDLDLALSMATDAGIELPLTAAARQQLSAALGIDA